MLHASVKTLFDSVDFIKAADTVLKGFVKVLNSHMNGFLKATKVDKFS
jgi:hypothetical protein